MKNFKNNINVPIQFYTSDNVDGSDQFDHVDIGKPKPFDPNKNFLVVKLPSGTGFFINSGRAGLLFSIIQVKISDVNHPGFDTYIFGITKLGVLIPTTDNNFSELALMSDNDIPVDPPSSSRPIHN